MQSFIYYVAATATAFAAIFILSLLLVRGQEAAVDTTQIMRAKNNLFTAMQNIELDFRNLGAGKTDVSTIFPAAGIDTLTCQFFSGFDCKFSFYGRVDSSSADSSLIQYFWRQSGSEYIDTDLSGGVDVLVNQTMYTLRRVVDGKTYFTMDRISRFRVSVYDEAGNTTANTLAIRQIEIDLRVMVPTTMADEALEEVQWSTFFRPVNLTRE